MENGIFQKLKWQFILWLARRLPDCKQMTRQLGESLDREIGWRDRIILKLHLFTCDACERYLEQVTFLKDAVHAHGDGPDADSCDVTLSRESKERIKSLLRTNAGLAL